MSISSHLEALRRKHATLKAEVDEANRNPAIDSASITEMKKQKLRIKEEIERLSVA